MYSFAYIHNTISWCKIIQITFGLPLVYELFRTRISLCVPQALYGIMQILVGWKTFCRYIGTHTHTHKIQNCQLYKPQFMSISVFCCWKYITHIKLNDIPVQCCFAWIIRDLTCRKYHRHDAPLCVTHTHTHTTPLKSAVAIIIWNHHDPHQHQHLQKKDTR